MKQIGGVVLVTLFVFLPSFAHAESSPDQDVTFPIASSFIGWFNVHGYDVGDIGKSISVGFGRGNRLYQFRHAEIVEAYTDTPIFPCSTVVYVPCRYTYFREYAALTGWNWGARRSRLQVLGGVGYLEFEPKRVAGQSFRERSLDERSAFRTVGLALDVGYVWAPSRFFALGARALADINSRSSITGVVLEMTLGKVR